MSPRGQVRRPYGHRRTSRMGGWSALLLLAVSLSTALTLALAVAPGALGDETLPGGLQDPAATSSRAFPHELHARLFPSCKACHEVTTGDRDDIFRVEPEQCAACHDGERRVVVDWTPPDAQVHFFAFDHEFHFEVLDEGDGLDCTICHQPEDRDGRMDIASYRSDACFDCHGLELEAHYAPGGDCETCHEPLAGNETVTLAEIEGFPKPEGHDAADFIRTHGEEADDNGDACATCHARETCERCHANAAQLELVMALESDERVAKLNEARPGRWPMPVSHEDAYWPESHGAFVTDSCANCHAAETCSDCHLGLPPGADQLAPMQLAGMPLLELRPINHSNDFVHEHAGAASARDCTTCHEESYCTDCHRDERGGYHPANFVLRHATSAYAHDPGCADCHSTEGFCRSCHAQSGLSPTRSRANGYHDSEPLWIINHGNAARQGLDTCVSCHQQADCLRCHSTRTGWGVNPHGPDFDGSALDDASLLMCTACHPRDFLRR